VHILSVDAQRRTERLSTLVATEYEGRRTERISTLWSRPKYAEHRVLSASPLWSQPTEYAEHGLGALLAGRRWRGAWRGAWPIEHGAEPTPQQVHRRIRSHHLVITGSGARAQRHSRGTRCVRPLETGMVSF
jgi:hypothetical protein